jgi:hypothetical protein
MRTKKTQTPRSQPRDTVLPLFGGQYERVLSLSASRLCNFDAFLPSHMQNEAT